jgi:transcriptional accessory protein Tex/SPT6
VQVEEAVEGLIHASELDADPQVQPRDVLETGQVVTAKVISLDRQRQRMGLSLRRVTEEQREEATPTPGEPEAEVSEPTEQAAPEAEASEPTEQATPEAEASEPTEQAAPEAEVSEPTEQAAPEAEASEPTEQAAPEAQPAEREAPEGTLAANETRADEDEAPRTTT